MSDEIQFTLEHGNKWPYDAPDNWLYDNTGTPAVPVKDWAHKAARGILADLNDRAGIKHGFREIDQEIRKEIVETIADIIRLAASQGTKP